MTFSFPSPEFDDAVAAICHGSATEAEMRELNALLRGDPSARDEYVMRVELHARLASEPDLFAPSAEAVAGSGMPDISLSEPRKISCPNPEAPRRKGTPARALALAACLALLATGVWGLWLRGGATRNGATSSAVAMFELQKLSSASEAVRYDHWRVWSARLNQDPSLVVHLAVVLDGKARQLVHCVNGYPVARHKVSSGDEGVETKTPSAPSKRVRAGGEGSAWRAKSSPEYYPSEKRRFGGRGRQEISLANSSQSCITAHGERQLGLSPALGIMSNDAGLLKHFSGGL